MSISMFIGLWYVLTVFVGTIKVLDWVRDRFGKPAGFLAAGGMIAILVYAISTGVLP